MSYRTTRAFDVRPATPPRDADMVLAFGRTFKRMMDERTIRAIVAVFALCRGEGAAK